jgi:hypothetical protein
MHARSGAEDGRSAKRDRMPIEIRAAATTVAMINGLKN